MHVLICQKFLKFKSQLSGYNRLCLKLSTSPPEKPSYEPTCSMDALSRVFSFFAKLSPAFSMNKQACSGFTSGSVCSHKVSHSSSESTT